MRQQRKIRCAIYCRVSTDEQDNEGFSSLDAQEESCKNFIESRKEIGWQYFKTYTDIATGANINRPSLKVLMYEAQKQKFDMILTYKIDRLTRSISDFYGLWKQLEELGLQLACTTQNIDTSDGTGRLMLNILLSFAQFEREINSQRVKDKRLATLKEGFWQGGWVPFGYRLKYSKKYNHNILVPDKRESEAVKIMYDVFIQTKSQSRVKELINAKGFRTVKRQQKTKDGKIRVIGGKRFDEDSITRILRSRLYIGELYDERTKTSFDQNIKHKAIIKDKNKWMHIQEILDGKSIKLGKQNRIIHKRDKYILLLKGLIRCSDCGSTMTISFPGKKSPQGEPYIYYICTEVNELGRGSKCRIRSMPARPLEQLILEATLNLSKHPKLIGDVVRKSSALAHKKLKPIESELAKLGMRKAEIDAQIKKSYELVMAEGIGALSSIAREESLKLEKEKTIIEDSMAQLNRQREDLSGQDLTEEEIKRTFQQFSEVIDAMTLEEKKAYCQLLINQILVTPWDPAEKKKGPSKKTRKDLLQADSVLQTRTRWYRIKIRYRELPDLPDNFKPDSSSLGLHPLGSGCRIRTCDPAINSRLLYR